MNHVLVALCSLCVCVPVALADETPSENGFHVYAPSRASNGLLVVKAEPRGDKLELTKSSTVDLGFQASTITAHPTKRLLYVAAGGGKVGEVPGAVVTLQDDGRYLSHKPVKFNHGYAYLSLDRTNRYLLGVDYGGGFVDVYKLDDYGMVEKLAAELDEGRKNAHCVFPSPDNKYVYIPYVKDTNAIFQYRFDDATGQLTPLSPKNAEPPADTGPRHMAYHPSRAIVYFSNEQELGVSAYDITSSGALKLRQVCPAVDPDVSKQGVSSSDIAITPDGKFLFAGIRGHTRDDFNFISRYRILKNGDVKLLGLTPADKIPWGLQLSPDANYLMVTAFEGATLTGYKITPAGDLQQVGQLAWDKNISDIATGKP